MTPEIVWTSTSQRYAAPSDFVNRVLRIEVDALEASVTFRRRDMPPFDIAEVEVTVAAGENHMRRGIALPGPRISVDAIAEQFARLTRRAP
jgi:hypothetical protein